MDYSLAANINSALLGGRGTSTQPGITVVVQYRDGVDDLITAKVAASLRNQLDAAGLYNGGVA